LAGLFHSNLNEMATTFCLQTRIALNQSGSQPAWPMNLDPVAKRVAHEEAPPGCWASVLGVDTCLMQSGSERIHIGTLKAKMPLRVHSITLRLYRKVKLNSTCIKPHTTSDAQRLRLGNLLQPYESGIKRTSKTLAALGHGDVNVGKAHGSHQSFLVERHIKWNHFATRRRGRCLIDTDRIMSFPRPLAGKDEVVIIVDQSVRSGKSLP
jgi:hypothetical protein